MKTSGKRLQEDSDRSESDMTYAESGYGNRGRTGIFIYALEVGMGENHTAWGKSWVN